LSSHLRLGLPSDIYSLVHSDQNT